MALIDPGMAARLTFILGITNLVSLGFVLLSCRCILGWRPDQLSKNKLFMKIYGQHCWFWRIFLLSVVLHAVLAMYAFGNPF